MRRHLENTWRMGTDVVGSLMRVEAQGRAGGSVVGRCSALRGWPGVL